MGQMKRLVNGATVRALREALGIKQTDFAARVGLSPSSLSHLEKANRQVAVHHQAKIATELGVSLDAISMAIPTDKRVAA